MDTQEYYGGTYPEAEEEIINNKIDEWDLVDLYEEENRE